jgi:hypothetical protein
MLEEDDPCNVPGTSNYCIRISDEFTETAHNDPDFLQKNITGDKT